MTLDELQTRVRKGEPVVLAREFISAETVHALTDRAAYEAFKARVRTELPDCETVAIVGSGNWGFSLNPYKQWQPFRKESDVDVAIISEQLYLATWATIREEHRKRWGFYQLAPLSVEPYGSTLKFRRYYQRSVCPTTT